MGRKKPPASPRLLAKISPFMTSKGSAVEVHQETPRVANSLADAIGYNGFPQNQGSPWSEQISQPTTIFKNLRWFLVSNMRQMLSEAYVEVGLVQTIVDVPVDDALRGGIDIKSKQLDENEIQELQVSLDRDDDLAAAAQAAKWNRLFGGAGILILTDQDPDEPLDMNDINPNTPLEFRAVDMWELFWDKQNSEGYDPAIQTEDFDYYNYYGETVHKSRVMRLKGLTAPSFIRPRLRGWGFSVVETLVRSINQYLKATDLSFEVLDEFKIDIYRIKNLVNTLMDPAAGPKVHNRIQMANWQKNYQNAIVMDSEDEYQQKQLSFAGLAETMAGIRMQVASDMRMPMTKLFGLSATGFASGEDDIEVYNSMVESSVRNKLKFDILRMIEIKCQKLFGFIPDDLSVSFKPLRMLSAEQEESVKNSKFNRLKAARDSGQLTEQEFRDACNRGNLFDIQLDTEQDLLNPNDPEVVDEAKEGLEDPKDPEDIDDPGANRADTRKARATATGGIPKGNTKPSNPPPASSDAPEAKARLKVANELTTVLVLPEIYSAKQLRKRFGNSAAFDRASYKADGGDGWIDVRRQPFFENPQNVDKSIWERAEIASQDAFGEVRWQFVVWMYRKLGGRFG